METFRFTMLVNVTPRSISSDAMLLGVIRNFRTLVAQR